MLKKLSYLIIDHDPEVVKVLNEKKIPCIYGTADDGYLLDSLHLKKAKLVMSTVSDVDVNLYLATYLKNNIFLILNSQQNISKTSYISTIHI